MAASLPVLAASPPPKHSPKPSQFRNRNYLLKSSRIYSSSSNSSSDEKTPFSRRRDVLLGLGGLYGSAALIDPAFGSPIDGPDMGRCQIATEGVPSSVQCCPPMSRQHPVRNFTFPDPREPRRLRRPAHLAGQDPTYVAKFEKAIKAMKCLPADDPRNFYQQARVHCAYCNGAYFQTNNDKKVQVHGNWLFLPFHRMYLYFYERILGHLIGDKSFALPYWNWDYEPGMNIPDMFMSPESPLFDGRRNDVHFPPNKPLDLNWDKTTENKPAEQIVLDNYAKIYTTTVSGARTPLLYYGARFSAGQEPPPHSSAGSGEVLHNVPHTWIGTVHKEDMGSLYSAARDPIFYSHHSNIDRLWNIWKSIDPFNRVDFHDDDYRDTSFLFYDENKELVRIKVNDVLYNHPLGFDYEDSPTPWMDIKRSPTSANAARKKARGTAVLRKKIDPRRLTQLSAFPVALDKVVSVIVPRPNKGRSKEEKEEASEVLVVSGITVGADEVIAFDVLVNDDPDNPSGPSKSEFAGSFDTVAHGPSNGGNGEKMHMMAGGTFRMDITELLEEIGAENDDELLVTFVPRISDAPVFIGGVSIELEPLRSN